MLKKPIQHLLHKFSESAINTTIFLLATALQSTAIYQTKKDAIKSVFRQCLDTENCFINGCIMLVGGDVWASIAIWVVAFFLIWKVKTTRPIVSIYRDEIRSIKALFNYLYYFPYGGEPKEKELCYSEYLNKNQELDNCIQLTKKIYRDDKLRSSLSIFMSYFDCTSQDGIIIPCYKHREDYIQETKTIQKVADSIIKKLELNKVR